MRFSAKAPLLSAALIMLGLSAHASFAQTAIAPGVLEYGNENLLGTGTYPSDPKAGATLIGLAPGTVTQATNSFAHGYPFSPAPGDFAGTDQIYVGSNQTGSDDGYSISSQKIAGPDNMSLDYSSLLTSGQTAQSLTLGIGADDFQFPTWGNPFTVTVNGVVDSSLTAEIDSLNLSGPQEQFFSIGVDPSLLTPNNVLNLSIDEGGNGGDGYAIDFLTVGVTTIPAVPEASSVVGFGILLCLGGFALLRGRRSPIAA